MMNKKHKKPRWYQRLGSSIKQWRTSKTTLFTAIVMVVIYTLINCLFGILNTTYGSVFSFDSTQTSEWFDFWKWVVVSGGAISITKIVKGDNSDICDDDLLQDDINNKEDIKG